MGPKNAPMMGWMEFFCCLWRETLAKSICVMLMSIWGHCQWESNEERIVSHQFWKESNFSFWISCSLGWPEFPIELVWCLTNGQLLNKAWQTAVNSQVYLMIHDKSIICIHVEVKTRKVCSCLSWALVGNVGRKSRQNCSMSSSCTAICLRGKKHASCVVFSIGGIVVWTKWMLIKQCWC